MQLESCQCSHVKSCKAKKIHYYLYASQEQPPVFLGMLKNLAVAFFSGDPFRCEGDYSISGQDIEVYGYFSYQGSGWFTQGHSLTRLQSSPVLVLVCA